MPLAHLENIFFNPFGFESVSIIRGGAMPFRANSEVEDCKEGGIISSSLAVKKESLDQWNETTKTAMQIGNKTKLKGWSATKYGQIKLS